MRIVAMGSTQGLGGTQTHFRLLIDFLVREGHTVGVIGVGDGPAKVFPGAEFSFAIVHSASPPLGKLWKAIDFWRARRQANRFAPELFLAAATGHGYVAMAKGLPARTFKIYEEVQGDIEKNDPMRTHMANHFDAIAPQSPSISSIYRSRIVTDKPIRTLPCFAHPPNIDLLPLKLKAGDSIRFCFFGRLASNKGLGQFLRAFSKVASAVDATLDIHGSGPERRPLEDLVNGLKLQDRVKLCGPYPEGDAYAKLMASYHCLVLPSIGCEGLPLVLVEAMSYGLPFLATEIGAIPDAARDNDDVMLMPPDEDGIVDGVRNVVEKLRLGSISNSRLKEFYLRHFSPLVFEEAWRRMLKSPRVFFGL